MKLYKNIFYHYTDIILPRLAEQLQLSLRFNNQFQQLILNLLFDQPTDVKVHQLTGRQLREAVSICRGLVDNPKIIPNAIQWSTDLKYMQQLAGL